MVKSENAETSRRRSSTFRKRERRSERLGRSPARLAMAAVTALALSLLGAAGLPAVAYGAGNTPPAEGYSTQFFYAYAAAGETITASGPVGSIIASDGTEYSGPGTHGPATEDGVWRIEMTGALDGYDWTIDVLDEITDSPVPGRVWSEGYRQRQGSGAEYDADLDFWVVNDTGYVYSLQVGGYNGINSTIFANSVGWPDEDCAPTYTSYEYSTDSNPNVPSPELPDCGEQFRVFFEEPANDLPPTSHTALGQVTVLPEVLGTSDLVVDDLAFTPAAGNAATGTFTYSINDRFTGGYFLQVDVDGDGSYDGERDRSIRLGADGTGAYSYEFDGLDGLGDPLEDCTRMGARVLFDKLGEVHFLQLDVEGRSGGVEIERLTGEGLPDSTVYWDDTPLVGERATSTPEIANLTGADSTGGVHGWDFDANGWGNNRIVDDWTYLPADFGTGEIQFGGRCLSIEKTSDATEASRPGDVVTYTVSATNTGDTDYTEEAPAVVFDDLTGVLDDAEYNDDATVTVSDGSTVPAPAYLAPSHLSWAGALAAGETVELTYTVTLGSAGDGIVANVAWNPVTTTPGEVPPTPVCDTDDGHDPVTGEPCDDTRLELPRLTITKSADATEIPTDGDEVTYTVTVTNEGPGIYTDDAPASMTDDLSEVLDDADFGEILEPTTGAEFDANAQELTWSGALEAGESIAIRYTVTYEATAGDAVLYNSACVPDGDTLPGVDSCATVRIPAGDLEVTKSVDPADGSAVAAGQEVTYTLTFESTGESAVTVDKIDDLSDVLDDAIFVDGSIVVSDPAALSAVLNGDELVIDGTIAAGETVTVSYTVTVNAYVEQEDHVLANVVQNPDGTCGPEGCPGTENPIRHFSVTKTADPLDGVQTGDTVNYTITVTNDGAADLTADVPASVSDDMTDVLDDAVYNDDATAIASDGSQVPAPQFSDPLLTWSGALAVGESVEIIYTVQVTNLGDHDLVNVASPVCVEGELCDPPVPPVEVPLPHIVPDKTSDPASGEDLNAGDVVTYTLSWMNDGQAPGALDSTDDLSDVLDDADITADPETATAGIELDLDLDAQTLRVTGELAPGETVTVTYQATVRADGDRGNNIARNVLTPDVPPYECIDGDDDCAPFDPPTTEHRIPELEVWKTVDPASGATVQAGQEVTYTLHFASTGEADAIVAREDVLTEVLDDASVTSAPASSDAALTVSDIVDERFLVSGTLTPGQSATVTYTVVVNADGARGDDRLGNFIVDEGEDPPATCEPTDEERPDCTVNHVSDVTVSKSADPASGTKIEQGRNVTYILTFRNVGTNPAAAPVAVDYTDHLSDVLDDAVLDGDPVSSDSGVTASVEGDTIRVTGTVATGDVVTVTYTVTPKAYEEQGNHILGNVVAPTGDEPICAPGSDLCTYHELTPPPPLATTGGEVAWTALIATAALLIGGAVLFAAGRRRREADVIS